MPAGLLFGVGKSQRQFLGKNGELAFSAPLGLVGFFPAYYYQSGSGPAEEDIASGGGYLQVIVLIVGYLKVAELQHL